MLVKIQRKVLAELIKQVMRGSSGQARYHKQVFNDKRSTDKQKLRRYHRLKQLGAFDDEVNENKQKDVFPKLGDNTGKILDVQGGLAKSIFPFDRPKPKPPMKFGKK